MVMMESDLAKEKSSCTVGYYTGKDKRETRDDDIIVKTY
jgi:hypothetical protein